jgi:plasmid stabilization system protein ParE
MAAKKITWTKSAILQLSKSIEYIRLDSPQSAEKVKAAILDKVRELSTTIIRHRADKYKTNNEGNFLCFEILKHRVSFYVTESEIVIVRVRHTKMNPRLY